MRARREKGEPTGSPFYLSTSEKRLLGIGRDGVFLFLFLGSFLLDLRRGYGDIALFVDVQFNHVTGLKSASEQLIGQSIFDLVLDETTQRPRTECRVITLLRQPLLRTFSDLGRQQPVGSDDPSLPGFDRFCGSADRALPESAGEEPERS